MYLGEAMEKAALLLEEEASGAKIGEIFEKNNIRDKVYIATKLPPALMRSTEILDKLFNEQLKRLRTDHIDFYLMHMMADIKIWERLKSLGIEEI